MSAESDERDPNLDQANRQLRQGLKSCRLVINNYRAMLGGDETAVPDADQSAAQPEPTPSSLEEESHGSAE